MNPDQTIRPLVLATVGVLAAFSAFGCQTTGDARQQIIEAQGVDRFDQIDTIRFTFNVERGAERIKRAWRWDVADDRVTYRGPDADGRPTVARYRRRKVEGLVAGPKQQFDPLFINDTFWLLPALHLSWSKAPRIADHGQANLPIGGGTARHVAVTYSDKGGGYTPGDAYDLFLDEQHQIVQWMFRRSNRTQATLTCTWDDYVELGPLRIAREHRTANGSFRLWFSDLAVKLRGADQWTFVEPPQP